MTKLRVQIAIIVTSCILINVIWGVGTISLISMSPWYWLTLVLTAPLLGLADFLLFCTSSELEDKISQEKKKDD